MIDTPTLFILGAGASKPYGYPTGAELRSDIVNNFKTYFEKFKNWQRSNEANDAHYLIDDFVNIFKASSLLSIDKYLSLNPNFSYIGKIAITTCIFNSEQKSWFNEDMNPADCKEDWYKYLYNRMTANFNKPGDYVNFSENKVAFITFNYDRSLEYFLYNSYYHSFYQSLQGNGNIQDYVKFPIEHVYGVVSPLSFSEWPHSHDYKKNKNYYNSVSNSSKGIRVIGEERTGPSIKDNVTKLLQNYKRIFFLGFSYAPENLEVIGLPNSINENWKIFGTAKGMTEKERNEVRYHLASNFSTKNSLPILSHPLLEDIDSCELLRKYL